MRLLTAMIVAISLFFASLSPALTEPLDFEVPYGHFFKQANGRGGDGDLGFAVVDDTAPFWSEFQRLGGVEALGYPISRRFEWDGYLVQAFQKAIFQWRPEVGQVYFVNVFDRLSAAGKDGWLEVVRSTPPSFDHSADQGLSWDDVVKGHFALLDQNPAIRARYFADPDPILRFGLPMSYKDYRNVFVLRAQWAVFQQWKVDVPWAKAGQIVVANGRDVAKDAGILPVGAEIPHRPERSYIVTVLAGPGPLYILQLQWELQSTAGSSNVPRARFLASDDLGSTWRPFPGDLPVDAACLYTVTMDYATRDTLYATSCQGIFRWTGALWEKISSRKAEQVSVVYGSPEILRATEARRVIESLDGGRSWRDLGLSDAAVVAETIPGTPARCMPRRCTKACGCYRVAQASRGNGLSFPPLMGSPPFTPVWPSMAPRARYIWWCGTPRRESITSGDLRIPALQTPARSAGSTSTSLAKALMCRCSPPPGERPVLLYMAPWTIVPGAGWWIRGGKMLERARCLFGPSTVAGPGRA